MILITRKLYFIFHSELVNRIFYCFYFFEEVTRKLYFDLLFRVSNLKILICLFNWS